MSEDASFQDLLAGLHGGDPDAPARIFQLFAHRLAGLARQRLAQRVRSKVDPEDVVQSVFRSFFARQAAGQFAFGDWDDLWNLLALITLRKCGHKVEHFRAACRDVAREVIPQASSDDPSASWQLIAREPTPAEGAIFLEMVERLLHRLEERDRRVLELSLEGERPLTIAGQLGCTERTVERALVRIRQTLDKLTR